MQGCVRFGDLTIEYLNYKQARNIEREVDLGEVKSLVYPRQPSDWEEKRLVNTTEVKWPIEL